MFKPFLYVIALGIAAFPVVSSADQEAVPSVNDHRVKRLNYNPSDVYTVYAAPGVATTAVFAPGEYYQSHFTGNSYAFEIVPQDNFFVFKPKFMNARTNLTVYTTEGRLYNFEVISLTPEEAESSSRLTYQMYFNYDDGSSSTAITEHLKMVEEMQNAKSSAPVQEATYGDDGGILVSPTDLDFSWEWAGDADIAPIVAFDDGVFVFLQFPAHSPIPAIFGVKRDRTEYSLNYHMEGKFVVIESIEREISLRVGGQHVSLRNIDDRKWMAKRPENKEGQEPQGGGLYD